MGLRYDIIFIIWDINVVIYVNLVFNCVFLVVLILLFCSCNKYYNYKYFLINANSILI